MKLGRKLPRIFFTLVNSSMLSEHQRGKDSRALLNDTALAAVGPRMVPCIIGRRVPLVPVPIQRACLREQKWVVKWVMSVKLSRIYKYGRFVPIEICFC